MTVTFKVPKTSYAYMAFGDTVTLQENGSNYSASITEISTAVDASGLFTVKATIENPPATLHNGGTVKVIATTQKAIGVPVVPLNAVHYDNGIPYVYIADNGVAKKTQVEVGLHSAQYIHIISGADVTSPIINTWSTRLGDGMEIKLVSHTNTGNTNDIKEDDAPDVR
jgi:membrane fusion protein (multidrug efflux system)